MPIIHNCEQHSQEWFELRMGIPTTSEFHKIITPGGKLSKQSSGYLYRLLAEYMLGEPIFSDIETGFMTHGREYERYAVEAFEFETGLKTQKVGFITTANGLVGSSPDRLVGDIGNLEIKSPSAWVHVQYMIGDEALADDYRAQVQGQLWVTEREKQWGVSYEPRLPSVVMEIPRDDEFISKIDVALTAFVDNMLEARLKLEREFGPFVRKQKRVATNPFGDFGINEEDLEAILGNSHS